MKHGNHMAALSPTFTWTAQINTCTLHSTITYNVPVPWRYQRVFCRINFTGTRAAHQFVQVGWQAALRLFPWTLERYVLISPPESGHKVRQRHVVLYSHGISDAKMVRRNRYFRRDRFHDLITTFEVQVEQSLPRWTTFPSRTTVRVLPN